MDENYILSVCGRQNVDGNTDKVELETSASYVMREGVRYISYKEYNPDSPLKHYRTTVKVGPHNVVTVIKGGEQNHQLILEKGERHKCEYNTPFGSLTLGVYTEDVDIRLDDSGGELTVRYSIDIESELASLNELTLKIKEAKNNVHGISNIEQPE